MKAFFLSLVFLSVTAQAAPEGIYYSVEDVDHKISNIKVTTCDLAYNASSIDCHGTLKVDYRNGTNKTKQLSDKAWSLLRHIGASLNNGNTGLYTEHFEILCKMMPPENLPILKAMRTTYDPNTYKIAKQELETVLTYDDCMMKDVLRPVNDLDYSAARNLRSILLMLAYELE